MWHEIMCACVNGSKEREWTITWTYGYSTYITPCDSGIVVTLLGDIGFLAGSVGIVGSVGLASSVGSVGSVGLDRGVDLIEGVVGLGGGTERGGGTETGRIGGGTETGTELETGGVEFGSESEMRGVVSSSETGGIEFDPETEGESESETGVPETGFEESSKLSSVEFVVFKPS